MSIKNQRPLFLFAAVIIGVTAASLIGLNLIVDHIAKLSPPTIAMAEPPPGPPKGMMGIDDAVDKKPPSPMDFPPPMPGGFDPRPRPKMPDMGGQPNNDAMRRVRNGKDSPDIRRTQPAQPAQKDDAQNVQRGAPPGYPPMPPMPPMDPKERERFEREMQQYGPPPGYYPPPGYFPPGSGYGGPEDFYPPPNDEFDNGYDYEENYYGDPDYYDGYDSNLNNPTNETQKTAEYVDTHPSEVANDEDPSFDGQDDYVLDEDRE